MSTEPGFPCSPATPIRFASKNPCLLWTGWFVFPAGSSASRGMKAPCGNSTPGRGREAANKERGKEKLNMWRSQVLRVTLINWSRMRGCAATHPPLALSNSLYLFICISFKSLVVLALLINQIVINNL